MDISFKKIAVLLHGSVKSDHRVVKTIVSLAKEYEVHLFFHGSFNDADLHFKGKEKIFVHPLKKQSNPFSKLVRHSFFAYEFTYLEQEVLKTQIHFDIVWANDLPTLLPAQKLSKQLNAKLIYDSHEIYVETINQFFINGTNTLKNLIFKFLIRVMKIHGTYIERRLLKTVDLMFTVNESLKAYFKAKYNFENIKVLMNLPKIADNINDLAFDFKKHFNWSKDTVVILYQGALNHGRGLELLIKSMIHLDESYCLVIMGKGGLKPNLLKLTKELNLSSRVSFIDAVSLSELEKYTKGADLGMNLLEPFNLSKKLASPNKLFEYIHAGIPVVASDTVENKKVFDKFRIGEICENQPDDVAEKIKTVARNKSVYLDILKLAKNEYSWDIQEDMLLKLE